MVAAAANLDRKIEVETENLDMVREAVEAGADIIMLDNMTPDEMAEAIRIIDGRAETECSGNMTKENIATITKLGVDYVSSGALTHSAPILDLSLKHLRANGAYSFAASTAALTPPAASIWLSLSITPSDKL